MQGVVGKLGLIDFMLAIIKTVLYEGAAATAAANTNLTRYDIYSRKSHASVPGTELPRVLFETKGIYSASESSRF